jgi:DNA-binding response OmpR family regulator
MDVLIVERDELLGSILTDALDGEGISAVVASDEEALKLPPDDAPQVVITGMNRGHDEDLTGLTLVATMRRKWSGVCAIYLATLWPARLASLAASERFLAKPVHLGAMVQAVRELLKSGICRQPAQQDGLSLPRARDHTLPRAASRPR